MKKISIIVSTIFLQALMLSTFLYAQDNLQHPSEKFVINRLGKGWIRDIEFSPDGETFAVATTIGVWIYNSQNSKVENQFEGIMGGAYAISYSPDGQLLAVAHDDLTIRIWEPTKKTQKKNILALRGHDRAIYDITFSPDGKKLASGSADKSMRLWELDNLDENKIKSKPLPYRNSVRIVAFSQDSNILAGGSDDGVIQVWDADTGDRIYNFTEHKDSVLDFDFSVDRKTLRSASLDGSVKIWSLVGEGGRLSSDIPHDEAVYSVKFFPDSNTFVTGSADKLIRLWNTETRRVIHTLKGHKDYVSVIDCSPDGTTLVSGSPDGAVFIWDIIGERTRFEILGHTGGIKALAYTEDNRIRAGGTGLDYKLRIWDAGTSSELSILRDHIELTQAVSFSNNGDKIVSGGNVDGTIFLSDVHKVLLVHNEIDENSLENKYIGNPHGVTALTMSPANTVLASGGEDGRIHLLDILTQRELKILKGAQSPISALTFVSDGTKLFSGEEDGTIRQWDANTGEEIGIANTVSFSAVTSIAYAQIGSLLLIGNAKGKIHIVRIEENLHPIGEVSVMPYPSKITSIMLSKSEKSIVIGCENGSIFICDTEKVLDGLDKPDLPRQQKNIPPKNNDGYKGNRALSGQQIAKKAISSTVYLKKVNANGDVIGSGSGFIVAPNKIATNYHVIKGATSIHAKLVDQDEWYYVERIAATDELHDLAILTIRDFPSIPLIIGNSDKVEIGEHIYAVGNPQGFLEGTVSDGIISGIRGEGDYKLIQMSAPISPGSSGGPVLNKQGEVIGIAVGDYSMRDPKLKINRSQNLNVAIPSNYLKALLDKVK